MIVLAIDPGNERSAWVQLENGQPVEFGIQDNKQILGWLADCSCDQLAVEMIASYGMPVGREVFETCVWIGRFVQAWGGPHALVYRRDVKLHLCGQARAKDSNIRQALIDRFGGPQETKKGGRLYKISKDVWSALAVAVTYADRERKEKAA